MGVGSCGWTSYANVSIMVRPSFTFMKIAPNSASAADDATNFRIVQRVISHFHGAGALFFDSSIGNAFRCNIVTVNGGWKLWMDKLC